jgi:hypothetical protein
MRVWLEILREKHPGVTWVPRQEGSGTERPPAVLRQEAAGS